MRAGEEFLVAALAAEKANLDADDLLGEIMGETDGTSAKTASDEARL